MTNSGQQEQNNLKIGAGPLPSRKRRFLSCVSVEMRRAEIRGATVMCKDCTAVRCGTPIWLMVAGGCDSPSTCKFHHKQHKHSKQAVHVKEKLCDCIWLAFGMIRNVHTIWTWSVEIPDVFMTTPAGLTHLIQLVWLQYESIFSSQQSLPCRTNAQKFTLSPAPLTSSKRIVHLWLLQVMAEDEPVVPHWQTANPVQDFNG